MSNEKKLQIQNSTAEFLIFTRQAGEDGIIAVGFRVNSARAIQFRQWAIAVLRDFAIRGYVLVKERLKNGAFRKWSRRSRKASLRSIGSSRTVCTSRTSTG